MFLKMSMVMMVAILLLNDVHQADANGGGGGKGSVCGYDCKQGDEASNINIQDSSVLNEDQISAFLDEFLEEW